MASNNDIALFVHTWCQLRGLTLGQDSSQLCRLVFHCYVCARKWAATPISGCMRQCRAKALAGMQVHTFFHVKESEKSQQPLLSFTLIHFFLCFHYFHSLFVTLILTILDGSFTFFHFLSFQSLLAFTFVHFLFSKGTVSQFLLRRVNLTVLW